MKKIGNKLKKTGKNARLPLSYMYFIHMLMPARQEVHSAQYARIKNTAVSVKNKVMEMIAKVRKRKAP